MSLSTLYLTADVAQQRN